MPAFSLVRHAGQTVLCRPEFQERVLAIFGIRGEAPPPEPSVAEGRAAYPAYPLDGKGLRGILKHCRRGGMLSGDLFFGLRRPLREFLLSERALRRGVPTAVVAAARVRPVLGLFYRGDLISVEIPGARDLGDLLKAPPPSAKELNRAVRAAARAVRKAHDAGLLHADLNLKNVMVRGDEAWVIDLDKSRLRPGPLEPAERASNLLRLGRSYLKKGGSGSLPRRFLAAYSGRDRGMRKALSRCLRTYPLSFHLHRLGWRLRPTRPPSRR